MKKKILFSIIILTVAFSAGIALKTKAGVGDSGTGWLWGGSEQVPDGTINDNETGVGWISMNSTNCDADNNGFVDVNYCDLDSNGFVDALCGGDNATDVSASCGGDNTTTAVIDYGVDIPAGNGNVSGEAWSENLGWIDFEPQSHCVVGVPGPGQYQALSCTDPDGGSGGVSRNATNGLEGWARIVSIAEASATNNSGGWEGWISMSGVVNNPPFNNPYGVTINDDGSFCRVGDPTTDGAGRCFAWANKDELGGIDFSRASIVAAKTLKICEGGCIAGTLLPNTITMIEGNFKNLEACYDIASDCTGGGDETVASAWAEVVDGSDVISLIDTDSSPETLNSNMVAADGTATFSVDYNDAGNHHIVNVTVDVTNVASVCPNGITEGTEECDDGAAGNGPCPAACSVTCTLNDCSAGSNWKEVAP